MQHPSTPLSLEPDPSPLSTYYGSTECGVKEEVVEFQIQIAKFKLKAAMVKVIGGVVVQGGLCKDVY